MKLNECHHSAVSGVELLRLHCYNSHEKVGPVPLVHDRLAVQRRHAPPLVSVPTITNRVIYQLTLGQKGYCTIEHPANF